MSRAVPWSERTARGSPDRLRTARGLTEELALVLEEMDEMDEDERREAHGHHRHAVRLLEEIREQVGPLGIDPAAREKRRREMVAENYRTNGGKP